MHESLSDVILPQVNDFPTLYIAFSMFNSLLCHLHPKSYNLKGELQYILLILDTKCLKSTKCLVHSSIAVKGLAQGPNDDTCSHRATPPHHVPGAGQGFCLWGRPCLESFGSRLTAS